MKICKTQSAKNPQMSNSNGIQTEVESNSCLFTYEFETPPWLYTQRTPLCGTH